VLIPNLLAQYTTERDVRVDGSTLGEVLAGLDRRYPGMRFRIVDEQDQVRPHVRFFVNEEQVFDLKRPVSDGDELVIVQALSGG
jgi:molybdopterin converting factor small subunit